MNNRLSSVALTTVLLFGTLANAQTMYVLHRFAGPPNDGSLPLATPVLDSQNNLYGTTERGGSASFGTVFEKNYNGPEIILHSFTGGSDGKYPMGGLVRDEEGNLFGTTSSGGAYGDGTVFKITSAGQESILFNFGGKVAYGTGPFSTLTLSKGYLYGTTTSGGAYGFGTVFKMLKSGKISILYSFGSQQNDGKGVNGQLWLDGEGNLFGTTFEGGVHNFGTIFKLSPEGQETILYSFTGQDEGYNPAAGVVEDASGNLYGTTSDGGSGCDGGCGIVYKLDTSGGFTILHTFVGGEDGSFPLAPLFIDSKGNLYGTTNSGGGARSGCAEIGCGTVFEIDSTGKETIAHAFIVQSEGVAPVGGVTMDNKGHLYGTTEAGGVGTGTVFELIP
jgi:uncharacterized repeat protein (TIGR03803 family)